LRWVDETERLVLERKILARRVSTFFPLDSDGGQIDYSYVPLVVDGNNAGAIEVAMPVEPEAEHVRASLLGSLLSMLGVAVLSAGVIFLGGVRWVGRPLQKLVEQVNAIGKGNFFQPPALQSNDELGRLATAISKMSHQLGDQRETIRHTDRLGTIGTLAAGVAHELGTPLNVVSGRAGLIATGKLSFEEVEASAKTIKAEADRMAVIIRHLLDFARQAPTAYAPMNVSDVVLKTCEILRPVAHDAKVDIVTEIPPGPFRIHGNAAQIQQVVTNLIRNAIQAMPGGGKMTVRIQHDGKNRVCVEVVDTGVGMMREAMDRVFEPFYTTKDVGEGTGLGLSIAYGIVSEHGGEIQVTSEVGTGTTFRVFLPSIEPTSLESSDSRA
jgi:signal transduction histidine kinase